MSDDEQHSTANSATSRVETLPGMSSDTVELLEGTRQRLLGDRAIRIQKNEELSKTRNLATVATTMNQTPAASSSSVASPNSRRNQQPNQNQRSPSNVNKNKTAPNRPGDSILVESTPTTSAVDISSLYASSRVPRMLSEMTNRTAIKHLMAQRDEWDVRRRRELYGGEDGRGVHMHVVDPARAAEREIDYQSELAAIYTLLSGYVDAFRLTDRAQLRNYNSEEVLGKMDAVYETLRLEMAAVEEATGDASEDGGERSGQSRQNDARKKQQTKHLLEDISSTSAAARDSEHTSLLANNEELQRRIGRAIVKSGTSKQDDYAMLQERDISKFYTDREVKIKTISHQLANAGFAVPLSTSTQSNYRLLQQTLGGGGVGEDRHHHSYSTTDNGGKTGVDDNGEGDDEEDVAVLGMAERIVNNLRFHQASNARAIQEEDVAREEMGLPPMVRSRVQPTLPTNPITTSGGTKGGAVSFDDFEVDTGLQERLWRATGMLSAVIRDDDDNDNDDDANGQHDHIPHHDLTHHMSSISGVDDSSRMPTAPSKESEVLREQSHQNSHALHEIAKEVIRLNTQYNGVLHVDDSTQQPNNKKTGGDDDDVVADGTVVKALFVEDDFKGRRPFRAFCEPFGIVESSPAAAALLCPPEFIREDEVKRHALARIQKTLRAAEEKRRVEANEADMNKKRLARITGGSVDYLSEGGGQVRGLQARVPAPSHADTTDPTSSDEGGTVEVPRTRDACIETVPSIADLPTSSSSVASASGGGSTFTIQSNFSKQYARDLANLFNKLATNNVVHVAVEEDPYFSTVAFPCVRNTVTPLGPLNGELLRQYYDYGLSPIAPKTIQLPSSTNEIIESAPTSVVSCSTRFSSRRWEIQRNLLECILHGGFDVRYVTSLLTELQDYAQDNAQLKAKLMQREKQLTQSRKYYNSLLQRLRSKEEVRVSRWAGNIADASSLAALLEYDDIAAAHSQKETKRKKPSHKASKSKSFEELRRYMGFTASSADDNEDDAAAPSETSVVNELMKALAVIRELKKSSATASSAQKQQPLSDATTPPNPMFELQRVLADSDALRKSLMISSGYFTPNKSSPSTTTGGSTVIQSLVDISKQEVHRCRRAMMEHCRLREELAMSQEDSMAHLFHMHVSTHNNGNIPPPPQSIQGGNTHSTSPKRGLEEDSDGLHSNLISPQSSMPRQSRRGSTYKKGVTIPVGAHVGVVSRMASSTLGSVLQSINGGSPQTGDQSPPHHNTKKGASRKQEHDPQATRAEDEAKLFPNLAVGGYGGMFQLGDNVFIKIRELFRALTTEQQAVLRHGRPLVPQYQNSILSNGGVPTPMPITDSTHNFLLKERAQLVHDARVVSHGVDLGLSRSPPTATSPRDAELAAGSGGEGNYEDDSHNFAMSVDMPSFYQQSQQVSRTGTTTTTNTSNTRGAVTVTKSVRRNLYNDPIRLFDSEGEAGFVAYILPRLSSHHAAALKTALSQRKDNNTNKTSAVNGEGSAATAGICSKCSTSIQPVVSLSSNALLPSLQQGTPLSKPPLPTTTRIHPTSSTLKATPIYEAPVSETPNQALPPGIPSDEEEDGFNGSATLTPKPLAPMDDSSMPATPRPATTSGTMEEGALFAVQHGVGVAAMMAEAEKAKAEIKRLTSALEAETATVESMKARVKHLSDQEVSSGESYRALVSEIEEMKYDWEEKEDDFLDQINVLKKTSEAQAAELLIKQQAFTDLQGKYEELTNELHDLRDDRNAVLRSTGVIEWLKITGGGGLFTGADHRASVVAASNRFRNLSTVSPSTSTHQPNQHQDKRTSPQNYSLAPPPGAMKAGIDKFDVYSLGLHRSSVAGGMSASQLPQGAHDGANAMADTMSSPAGRLLSDSTAATDEANLSSKLAAAAAASMEGVVDSWFPFEGGFGSEMWRDYIIPPATLPDVPTTATSNTPTKSIHSILKLAHAHTHRAMSGIGAVGTNPPKSPRSSSSGLNDDTSSPNTGATAKTSPQATKVLPKKKQKGNGRGLGGKPSVVSVSPLQRRSSSRVALLVPSSASPASPLDSKPRRRSSNFAQVAADAVSVAAAASAPQLLLVTPVGGFLGAGVLSTVTTNADSPNSPNPTTPTTTIAAAHATDVTLLGENQYRGADAVISSSMWWGSDSASFHYNIDPASSSLFSGEDGGGGSVDGNSDSLQQPASIPSPIRVGLPRAVIVPVAVQIPESIFHTYFDSNPINSRTIPPTGAARLSHSHNITTSTDAAGGTMSTNIHFNNYKNIAYIYYRKYHELRTRIAKKLEVELRRLEEEVRAVNNISKHPGGGNVSPSSISSSLAPPSTSNNKTRLLFESSNHNLDASYLMDGGASTRSDVSSSPQPPPRTFTDPAFLSVKMVDKCVGGGELPYNPFFLTPLHGGVSSSPSGTVTMIRMKPPHEGTQTDLVQSRTVPKILPPPEKRTREDGVVVVDDVVAAQRYWIQQLLTARTSRGGQAALQALLSVLDSNSPTTAATSSSSPQLAAAVASSMVGGSGPLSEYLVANMPSVAPWSTLSSITNTGAASSSTNGTEVGMSAASRISTTRPFYSKYLTIIDQESSTSEHHTQVYPSGLLTLETNENVPTQTSRISTPAGPETHGVHCQTDGELMRGYVVGDDDGDDYEVRNLSSESGAPPALNPFPSVANHQPPIRLNNRSGNVVDVEGHTSPSSHPRPLSVSASSILLPQMPSTIGLDGLEITTRLVADDKGRNTHYPPDAAVPKSPSQDENIASVIPPASRGGLPPMSRSGGARVLSPSIRQLTSAAAGDQRVGSRRGIGSRQSMARSGSSPVGDGILQSRERDGRGTPISNADSTIFHASISNPKTSDHEIGGNPSNPKPSHLQHPTPFVSLLESGNVDNYEAIPLEAPAHDNLGDDAEDDDGGESDANNKHVLSSKSPHSHHNNKATNQHNGSGGYISSSMRCTPSTVEHREEYRRIALESAGGAEAVKTDTNSTSAEAKVITTRKQPPSPFLIKTATESIASTTKNTTSGGISFGVVANKYGATRGRLVALHGVGSGGGRDQFDQRGSGTDMKSMGELMGGSSSSSMMISGVGGGVRSTSPVVNVGSERQLHHHQSSLFPSSITENHPISNINASDVTNRQHQPLHQTSMDYTTNTSSSPSAHPPTEYDRLTKAASAAMLRGGKRSGVASFRVPPHRGAAAGTNHHQRVVAAARIAQQHLGVRAGGMRGGVVSTSTSPNVKYGSIAGVGGGGRGDTTDGGVVPLARQGSLEPLRQKAPSPTEDIDDSNLMRVASVVRGYVTSRRGSPAPHDRTPSPSFGGGSMMLSLSHSTSFPIHSQLQPPPALSSKSSSNTAGRILSPISCSAGAGVTSTRTACSASKREGGGDVGESRPDLTLFNAPQQGSGSALYRFGLGPGEESSSLFVRSSSPLHGGANAASSASPPRGFNVFPRTRALLAPVGKSFGSRKKALDAAKARLHDPPPE